MDETPVDTRAFLNQIEGHLLLAAAREEARTAAARCTAGLDWLPGSQREELERRFTAEYLTLAQVSWQRTERRGGELRAEYEARYRGLLAGLLSAWALVVAVGLVVRALL